MTRATIFALSSGAPPAAVAVVRVSGPQAAAALSALHGKLPRPRYATLGWLCVPESGERLDRALLLWLPGPGSATGEDLAELHLHGGRAVTAAVLATLGVLPGLRLARPGEFTRRAFENGVIDLAEAEGLADLIAAETEAQRRNAQALAGGALSRRVRLWQEAILGLSAAVEATLDFADEDEVDDEAVDRVAASAAAIAEDMQALLRGFASERLRDGIRVVFAGPPNAGKSTLLNAIAGREAAITAPTAGTTRDLIEVPLAIAGIPFLLVDTAGVHDQAVDPVERIGIERARGSVDAADILVWMGPAADAPSHSGLVRVESRCDLGPVSSSADFLVSGLTGQGVDALVAALVAKAGGLVPGGREIALNRRQRATLGECTAALSEARVRLDPILVAESLRVALGALDRLTGRAGAEDMLDALFGRFCIGK